MPTITISRLFGSGGSDVAARVAALLGWSLLDNQIVNEVAARSGMPVDEVQAREERVPSLAARIGDALALSTPEVQPVTGEYTLPATERLIAVTRRVIEEYVARGPVVIVGRGAQATLAERQDAIHVFCYAPKAALVQRVMSREHLTQAQAEKRVDEVNAQRAQSVKRFYDRDWRAPENYHICVNTDFLGIEGAAQMVARAARGVFPAVTPERFTPAYNRRIADDIEKA
ncbi:MAG TPA: cytidylate kinase-like family protein [Gemmatimonadaceae bacterium]|nr:cytidylate kinase-like family protein [Gemmatimonadaceae bacterium]